MHCSDLHCFPPQRHSGLTLVHSGVFKAKGILSQPSKGLSNVPSEDKVLLNSHLLQTQQDIITVFERLNLCVHFTSGFIFRFMYIFTSGIRKDKRQQYASCIRLHRSKYFPLQLSNTTFVCTNYTPSISTRLFVTSFHLNIGSMTAERVRELSP